MLTDDSPAPVYGPPNRRNYADWMRQCPSERPLPATVQASRDRFQRALLGCHLTPVQSHVDGAVAASLTHREQRPPKPPCPCPDRCDRQSLVRPSSTLHRGHYVWLFIQFLLSLLAFLKTFYSYLFIARCWRPDLLICLRGWSIYTTRVYGPCSRAVNTCSVDRASVNTSPVHV